MHTNFASSFYWDKKTNPQPSKNIVSLLIEEICSTKESIKSSD